MQSLNRLNSERPRYKNDFYETPYGLCKAALQRLYDDEQYFRPPLNVLDAGCGRGVWGRAFNAVLGNNNYNEGIDIESEVQLGVYNLTICRDFLDSTYGNYDFIYGNPPYALAEEFVRKGLELVKVGGWVYFLLRLAFLESQKRHFGLFKEFPPKRVYVLSRRPSFFTTHEGRKTVDALSYAMFLWEKGSITWGRDVTELDWLYWEYEKNELG